MTRTISVMLSSQWGVCTPTSEQSFSPIRISTRNSWRRRTTNCWSTRDRRAEMMWFVQSQPFRSKLTTHTMRPTKKYFAKWKSKTLPGASTTLQGLRVAERLELLKFRIPRQDLTHLAQNRSWYEAMATSWLGSEGSDPYTRHIRAHSRIWADSNQSMWAGLPHNHWMPSPMVLGPSYLNLILWSRLRWGRQEMASVFLLRLKP